MSAKETADLTVARKLQAQADRIRELEAEAAGWKRAYDVDCSRLIKRAEAAESKLADLQDRVQNGFQGGCWCCESVAMKNVELNAKLAAVADLERHTVEMLITEADKSHFTGGYVRTQVVRADELEALLK